MKPLQFWGGFFIELQFFLEKYFLTIIFELIMKINTYKLSILIALVTLFFCNESYGQCSFNQVGNDINGASGGDLAGKSVAISSDGIYAAIGAPNNSAGGIQRGHVRIYKNVSGVWTQEGSDINGEGDNDNSGTSIDISSDGLTIAIGAPNNSGGGTLRGHVRIYQNISGTWTQMGGDIDGESDNDLSGTSVSLSDDGKVVAIGAPNNAGGGTQRGHVRVYEYNGMAWVQKGADLDGENDGDNLGSAVSLSGDGMVVGIGAANNSGAGLNAGHVRLYQFSSGVWFQLGNDIDGEFAYDRSGTALNLSGDGLTVAIGAPINDGGNPNGVMYPNRGHVRVFKYSAGNWNQFGNDIDGIEDGEQSGTSVSITSDGNSVAIGSPNYYGSGTWRGECRVYIYYNAQWNIEGTTIEGKYDGEYSGSCIGISSNGHIISGSPWTVNGQSRIYYDACYSPEIKVVGSSNEILRDTFSYLASKINGTNLGAVSTGNTITQTFKIVNEGLSLLDISSIQISGANSGDFVVNNTPNFINPKSSATFTITFTPSKIGEHNAVVVINNNDADEGIYDFRISAFMGNTVSNCAQKIVGDSGVLFGQSVSITDVGNGGLIMAIGAPWAYSAGNYQRGITTIWGNMNCGIWSKISAFDIEGEADGDLSGWSVSLSKDGRVVAIGAPNNSGGGFLRGHVRVFEDVGGGVWSQIGIDLDGMNDGESAGYSVALSDDGSIVAIGASNYTQTGSSHGCVRVYKNIGGNWTQLGSDLISGNTNIYKFGKSVSLSSDGLTVGIGMENISGNGVFGYVQVFRFNGSNWIQLGTDLFSAGRTMGDAVSLSYDGNTIAIGSDWDLVQVYGFNGTSWFQKGSDIAPPSIPNFPYNSGFGKSVALSANGSTIAIGQDKLVGLNKNNQLANLGRVLVYQLNASGSWIQKWENIYGESNITGSQYIGRSVSITQSGESVAIGGPGEDLTVNQGSYGQVSVYKLNDFYSGNYPMPLQVYPGTYNSQHVVLIGSYLNYLGSSYNLLLSLDTNGTYAQIPDNGVSLKIDTLVTTYYNNAGGIVTNNDGGVFLNRKWNVSAKSQPLSPVKVRYYFTQAEFDSMKSRLGVLNTNISSPTQLQLYKLNSNGFDDPHALTSSGVIFANGTNASNNTWSYSSYGNDHSAEFFVNSFSGGGIGSGVLDLSLLSVSKVPDVISKNVYPNPVSGNNLFVSTSFKDGKYQYLIMDITGRLVKQGQVAASGNLASIPVDDLDAASYILTICEKEGIPLNFRFTLIK